MHSADANEAGRRYAAWFHELDAWTEYWDVYQPQTHGRYYFGDGAGEPGLLSRFLPREATPAAFRCWVAMALGQGPGADFAAAVRENDVAAAVIEVDTLVGRLFAHHFGDAQVHAVRTDYLHAIHRFAIDTLPPATERDARIAADDPRKPTAGRHTLEGDMMWFCWALHTEAAVEIIGRDAGHARRTLMLAGVATGCPANFAWRGHRRTRPAYHPDAATAQRLQVQGLRWAADVDAARDEVHALFRIREWGHDG